MGRITCRRYLTLFELAMNGLYNQTTTQQHTTEQPIHTKRRQIYTVKENIHIETTHDQTTNTY